MDKKFQAGFIRFLSLSRRVGRRALFISRTGSARPARDVHEIMAKLWCFSNKTVSNVKSESDLCLLGSHSPVQSHNTWMFIFSRVPFYSKQTNGKFLFQSSDPGSIWAERRNENITKLKGFKTECNIHIFVTLLIIKSQASLTLNMYTQTLINNKKMKNWALWLIAYFTILVLPCQLISIYH